MAKTKQDKRPKRAKEQDRVKRAKALGWVFVHESPELVEDLGDGITRTTPASFRAEKLTDSSSINEEAETLDLLLTRIELYELHLKGLPKHVEPAPLNELLNDTEGGNLRNVKGAEKFQNEELRPDPDDEDEPEAEEESE